MEGTKDDMSEPIGTPETSMEAILASIRRIIAEDGIQPPPGVRPAPLPRVEPSSELNPSVAEASPPPVSPSPPPVPQPAPPQPPVLTMSLIAPVPAATPTPASPPPASTPAPEPAAELAAPKAVWGVLGDRANSGEELVLTQMVADDGSVVALSKRGSPAAAGAQPPAQPLDVLLLTDALPGSMPDVAIPVTPPQKSHPPAAPIPPAPVLPVAPAVSPRPEPAQPVSPPRPAPKPSVDADRPRVGLAAPETLVTSAAVLEQLARVRSQVRASSNPPAASIATANLEELVRQSLEPKIQEWLNANLLQVVERLVQQEIDRISRRT